MDNVIFIEGEKLTIALLGRVDTSNAQEVQQVIEEKIAEATPSGIIVDADKLEYISSAGLRILMVMRKKNSDLTMINVSRDIYEILEMTGFVDMFEVKKAMRKLSVEGCEVIGQGTCGKVYRIDEETIVKVFRPDYPMDYIEMEKQYSQKAFVHGIDTAISYDMVKVGDQIGLVYELLNADTFRTCMLREPEKRKYYIGLYAEFLKGMHSVSFAKGDLKDAKRHWMGFVDKVAGLSDEEKRVIGEMVAAVPERDTFIHGDYNPGNVMYQDGKALLIDMEGASTGHPIFDLAGVGIAFKLLPMLIPDEHCAQMTGFTKEENAMLWNEICEVYSGITEQAEREDLERQILPFSALRIVQASTAVNVFPESMVNYCKQMIMDANKAGVHTLKF